MIADAAKFAIARHTGQYYAGHTYDYHLERVEAKLRRFGYEAPAYRKAAWLHDTVEDTPTTIDEIRKRYGMLCGDLVWSVTGIGPNRKARNADIYAKLRAFPEGCPLKVADRLVNHDTSIRQALAGESEGLRMAGMYLSERAEFEAVVRDRVSPLMWAELQRTYAQLEAIVNA